MQSENENSRDKTADEVATDRENMEQSIQQSKSKGNKHKTR